MMRRLNEGYSTKRLKENLREKRKCSGSLSQSQQYGAIEIDAIECFNLEEFF